VCGQRGLRVRKGYVVQRVEAVLARRSERVRRDLMLEGKRRRRKDRWGGDVREDCVKPLSTARTSCSCRTTSDGSAERGTWIRRLCGRHCTGIRSGVSVRPYPLTSRSASTSLGLSCSRGLTEMAHGQGRGAPNIRHTLIRD
jgi:hypothetical protein